MMLESSSGAIWFSNPAAKTIKTKRNRFINFEFNPHQHSFKISAKTARLVQGPDQFDLRG